MKRGAFGAAELSLAMEIGERLLVSGAEISRVEDTITRICRACGARRVDVFTITSSIVVTAWGDAEIPFTQTRRVTGMAFNMTALSELNALSRRICAHVPENAEVRTELERIDALPKYGFRQMTGIFAMTALAFAIFFGGRPDRRADKSRAGAVCAARTQFADVCPAVQHRRRSGRRLGRERRSGGQYEHYCHRRYHAADSRNGVHELDPRYVQRGHDFRIAPVYRGARAQRGDRAGIRLPGSAVLGGRTDE